MFPRLGHGIRSAPCYACVGRCYWVVAMPITPYLLKGKEFDPDLIRTIGAAFERVCNALDCKKDGALRAQIAKTVIALAERGIKDADQLVIATLAEISGPARTPH